MRFDPRAVVARKRSSSFHQAEIPVVRPDEMTTRRSHSFLQNFSHPNITLTLRWRQGELNDLRRHRPEDHDISASPHSNQERSDRLTTLLDARQVGGIRVDEPICPNRNKERSLRRQATRPCNCNLGRALRQVVSNDPHSSLNPVGRRRQLNLPARRNVPSLPWPRCTQTWSPVSR